MKNYFLIIGLIFSYALKSQDVLSLDSGAQSPSAKIEDLDWLSGYWVGDGFGGNCEELWLPPVAGAIQGVFRFTKDGKTIFTEYMHVIEQEGSLVLKLKHFNDDLTPWEEKDQWISFKLVKIDGTTAWFHGLTYGRKYDKLNINLRLTSKDKSWIEKFEFIKKQL